MRLNSLSVQNFMSFEEADVSLADQGLVLSKGSNQDYEIADSNGAGKSALFVDAPLWILFGKTARGERSSSVVKAGSLTGCSGSLVWQEGGICYRVGRYQDHPKYNNGLTFTSWDTTAAEDYVEDHTSSDKNA